ncbi:hypothetical protein D3C85_1643110 [compost metagenome]
MIRCWIKINALLALPDRMMLCDETVPTLPKPPAINYLATLCELLIKAVEPAVTEIAPRLWIDKHFEK